MNTEMPTMPDVVYRLDPGGWLSVCHVMPELDQAPADQLLRAESSRLAGNLRYAWTPAGVVRLGEVRTTDDPQAREEAEVRLLQWMEWERTEAGSMATEEQIEGALAESGLAWIKRESAWVLPAIPVRSVEMVIQAVAGGACVAATLADLQGIDLEVRTALTEFLCRAHSGLRFARCEVDETAARVVSLAETEHFETDIEDSLGSVLAACRLLGREAQALLKPELAREYLKKN